MSVSGKGVIRKINQALSSKEISCKELTLKYLNEIKSSELNAYVTVCEEEALKSAGKVDDKISSGKQIGVLEGVPMTLKDNISTRGIETTCASKILKGYKPIYDAEVWSTLKKENSVLLGKTNMDEFAMGSSCETSFIGGAKNPHNLNHVSGGSSGGVASAVAGNIAAYGLGSDTGGSVRQPSSFCGVVGLKPTYGAVSRYGLVAYASSLDQIGPIARTSEDIAIIFDSIAKYDPKDSTSNPNSKFNTESTLNDNIKGLKLGIPKDYYEGVDSEISQAIEKAIKEYELMGVEVEYFDLPEVRFALPVYYVLACAEASSNLSRFDGVRYGYRTSSYKDIDEMICKTRSEGFGKEVKRRILLGNYVLSSGYYNDYYKKAQDLRGVIVDAFDRAFEKFDLLLAPTSPVTAFPMNKTYESPAEAYSADICTVPVNITGLPALSLPCGFDSNELPIGMQIIGQRFSESKILNAAHQFEKQTEFEYVKDLNMGVKI